MTGPARATALRLIKAAALSSATAQTSGMQAHPGDFVWVPSYVPHREENHSPSTEASIVIARSTQEAIVVNVDEL